MTKTITITTTEKGIEVKNFDSQYKVSQYIVITKSFLNDQYRLVYSTRSAKYILVQSPEFELLKNGNFSQIRPEIFKNMLNNKIVVPAKSEELLEVTNQFKENLDNRDLLSFVVQPSANCQLGCDYCGQEHHKDNINPFLAFQVLERFKKKITEYPFKRVNIGWFGGEALMSFSKIQFLSEEFIKICEERNVDYFGVLVTNGVLLKLNNFKRLYDLKIYKYEITIDGLKEHHDKTRMFKNGKGSFDIIMKNVLDVSNYIRANNLTKKVIISLRYNVTEGNAEGVIPFIDFLVANNLNDIVDFYIAPVHSWGNDAHLQGMNGHKFAKFEIEVFKYLTKKGFSGSFVPTSPKAVTCVAVSKHDEVIDAYGNVHKCSETPFVPTYGLKPEFKEEVTAFRSPFDDTFENWYDILETDEYPCHQCNLLPICGGDCPKIWAEGQVACPSFKMNIKDRLLLAFQKKLKKLHD